MSAFGSVIAVDWGTTNRRVFLLDERGEVLDRLDDDRGALTLSPADYTGEIQALRERFGDVAVVAAGMVGSRRGWREVPYVEVPATAVDLAAGAVEVGDRVTILPGVSFRSGDRSDVMRGEEVQVIGAIVSGMAPPDALFCQPGTHNKWIATRLARITGFSTAMTGELFALVRSGGTLAGMLDGPVADGPAFRAGVAIGLATRSLAADLFAVRAAVLLGTIAPDDAPARASGILIGADVGGHGHVPGSTVHLLAAGTIAALYAVAISEAGGSPVRLDSGRAFVDGILSIKEHLQ